MPLLYLLMLSISGQASLCAPLWLHHSLNNKYAKNLCKRTVLVQLTFENVFWDTVNMISLGYFHSINYFFVSLYAVNMFALWNFTLSHQHLNSSSPCDVATKVITTNFCEEFLPRAIFCIRADYAVARCLSVRLSVRHTPVLCWNGKHVIKHFHYPVATPFWLFNTPNVDNISTGTSLRGRRMQGYKTSRFSTNISDYLALSRNWYKTGPQLLWNDHGNL